jgi:LysR family transcriptional regulator, hypochlorite-specific transcription factor HypT
LEIKWLEDFLSLAETGSFSRSAELRHVTQPAFSRRIKALENWVGAELIDRTSYPTKLTPAGESFRERATPIVQDVFDARSTLRGQRPIPPDTLSFAVPHALSLNFYPKWLTKVERTHFDGAPLTTKLVAANVHDAVMALVEGNCDLLMCYHHPEQPIQLDPKRYAMIPLGTERICPYSKPQRDGTPLFELPGKSSQPIPYLAYSPNAFLGHMVEIILDSARRPHHLRRRYETDMAEALKVMAVEGHGVAWLPDSAVTRELKARQLVSAGAEQWCGEMQVRLYRERQSTKPLLNQLWMYLEASLGKPPPEKGASTAKRAPRTREP